MGVNSATLARYSKPVLLKTYVKSWFILSAKNGILTVFSIIPFCIRNETRRQAEDSTFVRLGEIDKVSVLMRIG